MFLIVLYILGVIFHQNIAALQLSTRINGGQVIEIENVPFMASLREMHNVKSRHHCGAVIISPKYLLTAAQCFYSQQVDWFGIAVGTNIKNDEFVVTHRIKRIVVHEKYDEFAAPFKNDIALIELNESLKTSEQVKPIPINVTFYEGQIDAFTLGFGGFYDNKTKLERLKMTTMTNQECRSRVNKLTPVYDFETLCAYSGDKNSRIGHGDAGGPLVHRNALIGLVSWNPQVVGSDKPEGFTRITPYIDWIKKNANSQ